MIKQLIRILEIDQPYFWATHQGAEIDLIFNKGAGRVGVEIKRMDAPTLTPSMKNALEDLKLKRIFIFGLLPLIVGGAMKPKSEEPGQIQIYNAQTGQVETLERVVKPDAEWKKILTPEQFDIMRRKGTERAFSKPCAIPRSGEGVYQCAGCGTDLFAYGKKFDSGTGWPSFFGPVSPLNVRLEEDVSFGMHRTEVLCARCGAHLGHVFDDGPGANAPGLQSGTETGRFGAVGPPPAGKRYCINTLALKLSE